MMNPYKINLPRLGCPPHPERGTFYFLLRDLARSTLSRLLEPRQQGTNPVVLATRQCISPERYCLLKYCDQQAENCQRNEHPEHQLIRDARLVLSAFVQKDSCQ